MMAETAGAGMGSNMATVQQVDISYSFWYNPELNYQVFMLPGILVILVTIIGMFLPALNLVREKEIGTIEQINVSPIKKYQFIAGKLVPFLIIGLFELSFGLAFGKLVYAIPLEGNLLLLFGFASVYLMAALGMGLFISASSSNQQQVMFMSFFFLLTFILMSGIFTPVESMPHWASWVNIVNPFAYFMKVIRMVLLKGSTFADIRHEFFSMLLFAAGILSLAVWRYRKIA
jgi:ABC-2 type transport system permease protein